MEKIRKAIMSGEIKIGSLTMKVHTLDDGTAIIEKESMEAFFELMANGGLLETPEMKKELENLAKFSKTGKL